MSSLIVLNTGPLIAFARLEVLDVIGKLPFQFLCPLEVRHEIDQGVAVGHTEVAPSWLRVEAMSVPVSALGVASLDSGEAAVTQLALDWGIPVVGIDEWKGRRAAQAAGLQVTGSLGLLAKARMLGLVPSLSAILDRAEREGLRYHPELLRRVLSAVGE